MPTSKPPSGGTKPRSVDSVRRALTSSQPTQTTVLRSLNRIAAEIVTLWRDKPPSERTVLISKPYVLAMLDLRTCKDMYGLEYGDMIVAYALSNLTHWSGEDARRIKAELKQHLEEFNATHHR